MSGSEVTVYRKSVTSVDLLIKANCGMVIDVFLGDASEFADYSIAITNTGATVTFVFTLDEVISSKAKIMVVAS
jgi:hypothetical protein